MKLEKIIWNKIFLIVGILFLFTNIVIATISNQNTQPGIEGGTQLTQLTPPPQIFCDVFDIGKEVKDFVGAKYFIGLDEKKTYDVFDDGQLLGLIMKEKIRKNGEALVVYDVGKNKAIEPYKGSDDSFTVIDRGNFKLLWTLPILSKKNNEEKEIFWAVESPTKDIEIKRCTLGNCKPRKVAVIKSGTMWRNTIKAVLPVVVNERLYIAITDTTAQTENVYSCDMKQNSNKSDKCGVIPTDLKWFKYHWTINSFPPRSYNPVKDTGILITDSGNNKSEFFGVLNNKLVTVSNTIIKDSIRSLAPSIFFALNKIGKDKTNLELIDAKTGKSIATAITVPKDCDRGFCKIVRGSKTFALLYRDGQDYYTKIMGKNARRQVLDINTLLLYAPLVFTLDNGQILYYHVSLGFQLLECQAF